MIEKLRKRFILIAVVSVTLVMILLCFIVNIANYISVNNDLTQMLETIYINEGRIPFDKPFKPNGPKESQFTKETPYSTRFFVLRYNENGELFKADLSNIAAVTENNANEYMQIALKHGTGYGYTSGYKYYVAKTGTDKYMAIFLDCYEDMRSIYLITVLSVVAIVVCVVLVFIFVTLLSKRAVEPVVGSYQKQKQFITDVSHELNTPITVIATSLKVLEMETGKQKWIDKATLQIEKLKNLVHSLVKLSKIDEGELPFKHINFNISSAVLETAESFKDYAQENGHKLIINIVENAFYIGDEYSIRQLVSILLDNAVKYAASNSDIKIYLLKSKKGYIIKSENECDYLDDENLNKLFDRFYRPDKSRNSATGGFGIGLSIAKSITEGHKGSIKAQSKENIISFIAELK